MAAIIEQTGMPVNEDTQVKLSEAYAYNNRVRN